MTSWFNALSNIINPEEPGISEDDLPRAAAVLLLEMAAADHESDPAELKAVERAMEKAFDLEADEREHLIKRADRLQKESVSLHDYTRQLRLGLEPEQRADLIESLWRVAQADGRIDRYEEHLLRRLADLLGVPHKEFIRRKLAVTGE